MNIRKRLFTPHAIAAFVTAAMLALTQTVAG